MRFRRRQEGLGFPGRGVARTAAAGITRHELVKEAVQFLLATGEADRIGVWIESRDAAHAPGRGLAGFQGMVANRDGEATPSEWERLSAEAPLPIALLNGGKSVAQDLDGSPDQLILGALVELQRAVWVPVEARGHLRGVLLAGVRKKHGTLPVKLMESVSAELALAVELEEERRLARDRQSDLAVTKSTLDELARSGPSDATLTRLLDSCTDREGDGLGAVFAVLHTNENPRDVSIRESCDENSEMGERHSPVDSPSGERRAPRWQSGDSAWLHAIESQSLAGIWQRALETQGTINISTGAGMAWPRGNVARLVAIRLEADGETVGVLAAGFGHEAASKAVIERLELRAALATTALILRKRNDEVSRQRARQRALLQASSGATILVEDGGEIGGLSRGALELLGDAGNGYTRTGEDGPPASRKFGELVPGRERQQVETWLRRVQTSSRVESGIDEEPPEVELRNGDRVRLRCMVRGSGFAAVTLERVAESDVTTRRDRAEAQLFNVIEWLEEGVVLFDAQHGIRVMNTRFAQIAGLSPEDTGRITTLSGLIARLSDQAAEPEKFAKRWRDLARGADSGVREEIQLLRPVPRVLERAARPVLDADGRRIGRVEIYRDLTAQRVFQSKLLQTEKLAALGQMVTGVAHELSNPLTSILGYAQRLFLRNEGDGQSDEVRQIFQEAERASRILRQLLMGARESRPERRRVSLNQIVSRTLDLQRFNLAAEKVNVELHLDPALPCVLGDAGQLQQVLMNLIGNARQAIEPRGKGGTIRLSTKRIGSCRARLEVSDDGPGIPQAIASRIFDPFFTTKPAGIGTGLGLAIVLGVVQEHGGQVKVASPPGGGAVFSVEFPAAPAEESRSPALPATGPGRLRRETTVFRPPPARASMPGAGLPSTAGMRVLVVEDEPTVARLIGDVLEDEGFQVDALLDGHQALDRAAQEVYDLVICDMKMPGLDGQHFYKTLAGTGNPLAKRFLFVTGDVIAAHTHEFLELHQLPHVAKPFRVEELTEKVRRVLADVERTEISSAPAARTKVARK